MFALTAVPACFLWAGKEAGRQHCGWTGCGATTIINCASPCPAALRCLLSMVWASCGLTRRLTGAGFIQSNSGNWQQHLWTVLGHSKTRSGYPTAYTAHSACSMLACALCLLLARPAWPRFKCAAAAQSQLSYVWGGSSACRHEHSSSACWCAGLHTPAAAGAAVWFGCICSAPLCGAQFCHCRATSKSI